MWRCLWLSRKVQLIESVGGGNQRLKTTYFHQDRKQVSSGALCAFDIHTCIIRNLTGENSRGATGFEIRADLRSML
jgi:hypothetical protein